MNTIFLLRHAEAQRAEAYDHDEDRDLTPAGVQDARRLGQFLAATEQLPDCFVTSTAVRARDTAKALSSEGQWKVDVPLRSSHAIYQAEPADVVEEIQATKEAIRAVMMVGHEPTLSTVASGLLGSANISMSPCTCLRIDAEVNQWSDIQFGRGVLRWMVPPTLLR